jgi:hypothetical protein
VSRKVECIVVGSQTEKGLVDIFMAVADFCDGLKKPPVRPDLLILYESYKKFMSSPEGIELYSKLLEAQK